MKIVKISYDKRNIKKIIAKVSTPGKYALNNY